MTRRRTALPEPTGRVAIVTGAAGGTGRIVTRDLAAAGWRLGLVGTHKRPLQALAAKLGLPAGQWTAEAADLRNAAATSAAVDAIANRFGTVDALVHLVGGFHGGESVVDVRDAEVGAMLGQHLWTTLNVVRAVVPRMVAAGWGRVVAISSPQASAPTKGVSPYAIGKAAQEALLMALAREVAGTGTTANVILCRQIDVNHERDANRSPKNAWWTTPEEISAEVAHLLSDEAAAINGAKIPLYGNG
jgi:NAD(P)-dependent dehydrogenase (short-subunit alcohol dehydrogenase family)